MSMLAHSNVERRAKLRKLRKSLFELLPDPTAILFEIESAAARNCSAYRYRRRSSNLSAIPLTRSPGPRHAATLPSFQTETGSHLRASPAQLLLPAPRSLPPASRLDRGDVGGLAAFHFQDYGRLHGVAITVDRNLACNAAEVLGLRQLGGDIFALRRA